MNSIMLFINLYVYYIIFLRSCYIFYFSNYISNSTSINASLLAFPAATFSSESSTSGMCFSCALTNKTIRCKSSAKHCELALICGEERRQWQDSGRL